MKEVVTDKWILCPVCKAKTRTQILDDTELKHFPLFCPKCKESFIINVKAPLVFCLRLHLVPGIDFCYCDFDP